MSALQALSQYLVNINVWAHNILTLCARAFCSKEVRFCPCIAPNPLCSACVRGECSHMLHLRCIAQQPAASAQQASLHAAAEHC